MNEEDEEGKDKKKGWKERRYGREEGRKDEKVKEKEGDRESRRYTTEEKRRKNES